jgi:hypothetical protein
VLVSRHQSDASIATSTSDTHSQKRCITYETRVLRACGCRT